MFIATKISPQDHAAIREHAHALGKADRLAGITRTPLELADATVPCLARLQRHLAVDPHRSAALRVWGDMYREARSDHHARRGVLTMPADKTPVIYPETTTLLCYVGDATYRVLAYDKTRGGALDEYVERLERTPDEWPGWCARSRGNDDTRSRGLYTLYVIRGEDGWHMSGWERLTLMQVAHAALGTWTPATTPAHEIGRRAVQPSTPSAA